jgi:hypothetical protein
MGFGPFRIIKGIIFLAVGSFILGGFISLLWNALVPEIFHGTTINYIQGVGLFLLSRLLLGHPFSGGGGRRGWNRNRWQKMGMQDCPPKHQWNGSWNNDCEPGETKAADHT